MASESLHERFEDLTPETRDLHRAVVSLAEELDAVDWYGQRVDATQDEELRAVLAHNRNEEIEHAMMNLEWIRRRNPTVDAAARMFLFSEGPITEVEEKTKLLSAVVADPPKAGREMKLLSPVVADPPKAGREMKAGARAEALPAAGEGDGGVGSEAPAADGSLGIGSLKLV